jgi:hypothetical protein
MFYMQVGNVDVNPYTNHTMKGYQRGGGLQNKTSPYIILFKNPRDERQVRTLGSQIFS